MPQILPRGPPLALQYTVNNIVNRHAVDLVMLAREHHRGGPQFLEQTHRPDVGHTRLTVRLLNRCSANSRSRAACNMANPPPTPVVGANRITELGRAVARVDIEPGEPADQQPDRQRLLTR